MTPNDDSRADRAKEYGEALERQREAQEERSNVLRFEFVASELDLAVTFCESAASTSDRERSSRNLGQAEKAYESAAHFLAGQHLSESMRCKIQEKVRVLEPLLKKAREKKAGKRDS